MLVFKYVKTTNVGVFKYVKCNACLDDLWNVLPVPAGGAAGLAIDFKVYDFDAGSEDDCMDCRWINNRSTSTDPWMILWRVSSFYWIFGKRPHLPLIVCLHP